MGGSGRAQGGPGRALGGSGRALGGKHRTFVKKSAGSDQKTLFFGKKKTPEAAAHRNTGLLSTNIKQKHKIRPGREHKIRPRRKQKISPNIFPNIFSTSPNICNICVF